MATASSRGRTRGRPRSQEACNRTVDVPEFVFGADLDVNLLRRGENTSSMESEDSVSVNTDDAEERKKKLDRLVYRFMAHQLISGLREHRLEQIMQKYMNLNDDQDASPAASSSSSSGSSNDEAKQVASDQPSPTSSTHPVAICETSSNDQPSSQTVIEETVMNLKAVQQDIIPDIPTEKPVYIGRGRGRGIRNETNKCILRSCVRLN